MARWDEILSLPVQNPPTLEFSSDDLVWTKVEGWRDNIDRVALIPFARVDDFVRGESSNKDCPTRFHVEARRRRPPEMTYKPKVDGILEYILYWCSFGPDDHRKGGIVRPSRSTYVPKKKSAGRPNTKRGCTCHFIVKRLIAEPSVALVIYNQDKHVDKKGLPCHGPQDKKAAGTRAMYAPYISEDLRLRVLSLLYVGVSVETIMQRHNESVERQGGPSNRDDLLTHRYVRRQERSIRRSTYELDADDAVSISMWVESHQNHVFFYEDFSDSNPFVLGIQTEWQLQQMIRFGNHSLVASDSRFGTNKLKYPVHSLVVFNSDNKAIPVAWIIAPRFACGDTHRWMRALYNRVHTKDPMWKLAGFIVDDPSADILTIREVFQCSVLISFWRVRHAWHRNIIKRCSEIMRAEISRQLGQIVHSICKGHGTVDLFQDFMVDFIDESEFMDYFKAIWYPRMELWTSALKDLPLASQETSAAMEFYHNQMTLRLLNEKDPSVYQRADWLVDKLGTKVHSYFWLDEYSEKDDFARYQKDEWMNGLTSWRKSLKIPDSDVVMEGKRAKVLDQDDRNKAHVVFNPGSEFGICDCIWAEKGNLCEHVLKIIKVFRLKGLNSPSISMFQYNQALINMLHCPPHDSLIRDHAVSLAVWVQNQLNTLVDVESTQTIMDTGGQLNVAPLGANQEKDKISENHCTNKSISSHAKNGSTVGQIALDCVTGDLVANLFDQLASENGICGERNGADISSAEMEVDPASICTPSSGLFSVDGVAPTNLFTENGERMLVDAGPDITKNLPSTDDSFTNLNGFEDDILDKDSCESAMDMESEITPILPKINSKPISDTQLVNMVDTAGGTKDVRGIGVHNGNGNMRQNLLSVDDDVLLVGIQDSAAKDYSNCCNAEKVNFEAPGVPSEKPWMCHQSDYGGASQPLADVMPLAVQNRITDSDLDNNTKGANFRCKTDDTSASLSISASIDSQLANMVEAVGEIEENREMCPLTENGSSTQIISSVDDEIPVTGCNEPENSNPFDTRGRGNMISVSQESSQDPSNSISDKSHLPVDPAKQETSTYVEPSSSIEPLPVKRGTSDQIAVGKFSSEMIRQQETCNGDNSPVSEGQHTSPTRMVDLEQLKAADATAGDG